MVYDIIDMTEEEFAALSSVQLRLLRTAQVAKNELLNKLEDSIENAKTLFLAKGTIRSSIYVNFIAKLREDTAEAIAELADKLRFNLDQSAYEPDGGGDVTDPDPGEDGENGYIVDYRLSYVDRYVIVRDYYLSITDRDERIALYEQDEVAKKYLQNYYATLYDVLLRY